MPVVEGANFTEMEVGDCAHVSAIASLFTQFLESKISILSGQKRVARSCKALSIEFDQILVIVVSILSRFRSL